MTMVPTTLTVGNHKQTTVARVKVSHFTDPSIHPNLHLIKFWGYTLYVYMLFLHLLLTDES